MQYNATLPVGRKINSTFARFSIEIIASVLRGWIKYFICIKYNVMNRFTIIIAMGLHIFNESHELCGFIYELYERL